MSEIWTLPSTVLAISFAVSTAVLCAADMTPDAWYLRSLVTYDRSPGRTAPVPFARLWRMVPIVARNGLLAAVTVGAAWTLRLWCAPHAMPLDDQLDVWTDGWWQNWVPWPVRALSQVAALNYISQLWFFFAHRWVHSRPDVFRFVHAMHHQHAEPVALTAIHCTMSEMLLLNVPAAALGPLLVLPDLFPHCVWMCLVGLYTPIAHSGHNFGWLLFDAQFHDDHHRYLTVNYGSVFLDRLFGSHADSLDSCRKKQL